MEKIAYFEDMNQIGLAYADQMEALLNKKETILENSGWESEELKQVYQEIKELKDNNPYTSGEYKACYAYNTSLKYGEEEIILRDFLWDSEVEDFANTMKTAGVKSFIYANESSSVMQNIHGLSDHGYTIGGLYKKLIEASSRFDRDRIVYGIRFIRG